MAKQMRIPIASALALLLGAAMLGCGGGGGNSAASSSTTTSSTMVATASSSTTSSSTTSSSTTTSSTTSSSTTSTSTTTSTLAFNLVCTTVIRVTSNEAITGLQYDIDYSSVRGRFLGSAGNVACTALAGDSSAFNDKEDQKILTSAIASTAGFTGPTSLARCSFETNDSALSPADFPSVTITEATGPGGVPINPTVVISSVSCGGTSTTSTTTMTSVTTTTSITTTTTTPSATTTTTLPGSVTIDLLLDDPVTLGALQFTVDYSSAPGGFRGSGEDVDCTKSTGDLVTFNDNDNGMLTAAFISLTGFTGPTKLATCTFDVAARLPQASDFSLSVLDATGPNGTEILPSPSVSVGIGP